MAHSDDGFDFLGYNVRKYTTHGGNKLLIKPFKNSMKSAKKKVADVGRGLNGSDVGTYTLKLHPIIIRTANYWDSVVAKEHSK
ncbi:hypothetical protein [Bacillus cereus]|uniref:hypothetical protein n=1 Tax=Bacillus cereus TaxID=1396 RepID=UPI00095107F7|nr:hypothetical protein [Bacillus cereus]OLR27669.1 hypothetical protein BLD50_00370 [Bacillus cereus]